jgi:hypothetical protein
MAGNLAKQISGDEISAENEEDIDPDEATLESGNRGVEK